MSILYCASPAPSYAADVMLVHACHNMFLNTAAFGMKLLYLYCPP